MRVAAVPLWRSRSVAIVTNGPTMKRIYGDYQKNCCLNFAYLSCDSTTPASRQLCFLFPAKWTPPTNYCIAFAYTHVALVLRLIPVYLYVQYNYYTQPQALGYWCFNQAARVQLLSPLFVSMDTTKLGLMLQARKLQVIITDRHLLLTNQITVSVTTMI